MRVRILGESVIALKGHEYTPQSPHFFALLLRLSADAGHFFTREELASLLFPTSPSAAAAMHSVRQLLYQARRRGAQIDKRGDSVALAAGSLEVDINDLFQDGRTLRDARRDLTILPGYAPSISEAYTEWLEAFRDHNQSRLRHVLIDSIELSKRRADWASVEACAVACLASDPLNELATLALAEALARSGSKSRALRLLDSYKQEVGAHSVDLSLPATLLRRRIDGQRSSLPDSKLPFLDRGEELSTLHAQFRYACAARHSCTVIQGEAGIGKTRLLEEFYTSVLLSGQSSVAFVRRPTVERFRPYSFFAQLVPLLLKLPGAAGRDPQLATFLDRVTDGTMDPTGGSMGAEESVFITAGIERAIVDLLDSISAERTLVILVDDSRALDDVSLALLEHLSVLAPTLPLLVVLVRNTLDTHTRLDHIASHHIFLKPLKPASADLMLDALLASTSCPLSAGARQWCIAIAGGNPQFLTLVADECSRHPTLPDVPLDIVEAVDQLLFSLSFDAVRVLEACVVLDEHCSVTTLESVIGTTPFSLLSALQELERSGLLYCDGDSLLLRSTSFRDRVLANASKGVLALLHARSAQALGLSSTKPVSPWTIASHWHGAGQPYRAHKILSASWRRSIQLGQPKVAEESIREHLASHIDSATSIPIYEELVEAVQASGNAQATIDAIDERAALISRCGVIDERGERFSFDRLAAELQDHADPSCAESALKDFMRSTTLDRGRRLQSARLLLASADASADRVLAEEVFKSIITVEVTQSERADFDQAILIYHAVFGDKKEALTVANRALSQTRKEPRKWLHVTAQMNASLALRVSDPTDAAVIQLSDCYEHVRAIGATAWCIRAASRIANFTLDDGDIALARHWASRASVHAAVANAGRLPVDYLSAQADVAIITGNFDEARKWIDSMRVNSPIYKAPRFRMELLSYSLRLAQYEHTLDNDEAIEALLEWHFRAREFARHDDAMDALWFGLTQQGRGTLASKLLTEYLASYRREACQPGHFLRYRSAKDRAWREVDNARAL